MLKTALLAASAVSLVVAPTAAEAKSHDWNRGRHAQTVRVVRYAPTTRYVTTRYASPYYGNSYYGSGYYGGSPYYGGSYGSYGTPYYSGYGSPYYGNSYY